MSFTYGKKDTIIYNGYNLREMYDLYVVDEDITLENQLGVKQTVNVNNNTFVNVDKENFTFTLKFIRKINGQVSSLDSMYLGRPFLDEINRIIFSDKEINILEIGGRIYYVVPISGTLRRHSKNIGEFSIEFQSLSPYCYSSIIVNNIRVDNTTKEVTLNNIGNRINIIAEIGCVQAGDITITNNRTGNSITVLDCKANEEFKIDADNVDIVGIDFNEVTGNIKDTLSLEFGNSVFSVECTGIFKVNFRYQCEINVY